MKQCEGAEGVEGEEGVEGNKRRRWWNRRRRREKEKTSILQYANEISSIFSIKQLYF